MEKIKTKAKREKTRIESGILSAYIAVSTAAFAAVPACAASTLAQKAGDAINSIYKDVLHIVVPLYALVVVIGCARIFFTNGRKADGILDWIKRASLAFAAILCVGWIITFIMGLTSGGDTWSNKY